jgi:hypothetical protein
MGTAFLWTELPSSLRVTNSQRAFWLLLPSALEIQHFATLDFGFHLMLLRDNEVYGLLTSSPKISVSVELIRKSAS